MKPPCDICDRIHDPSSVVAVGRFKPGGPDGYKAPGLGAPMRATRGRSSARRLRGVGMSDIHTSTTPVVHLPSVRLIWRTRDDAAATTVLALCDEIERLRIDLERSERGEAHYRRDAEILREQNWQIRRDVARAIGADR